MKKLLLACMIGILLVGAVEAKITLPKAKETKLDNGITVQVVERPKLPLFSVQMIFRAGSICDPAGKEGLASLTSAMLKRGTATRSAKEIVEEVAFGGGTLGSYCGRESAGFTGEFLSADAEKAMSMLADLLMNSTFTQEEIDKIKTRTLAGLESERDDPSAVANLSLFENILGGSAYAHQPSGTVESVQNLMREDILDFMNKYYTPDNCILIICGDISANDAATWAKTYFKDWHGRADAVPLPDAFATVNGKDVLLLDKVDASQTQIRIGIEGLPIGHPDFFALEVARTIYAGTFTSRLMDEIRVNRGLSYGVSCVCSRYRPGGLVYVTTFTKNESVGEVVDIILSEADRMQTEPLTDDELAGTINYKTGLYPLGFETNDDIADVYAAMWLNGTDRSYYEDYQETIRKITKDDVLAAAKKYFPKDRYRLVLVGKADEVQAQAEKFGPVTVRSVTEL